VLTTAMLGIADFRKSDPQAIIEATSMLYRGAYNILDRMHGEQTTRNMGPGPSSTASRALRTKSGASARSRSTRAITACTSAQPRDGMRCVPGARAAANASSE